MFLFLLIFITIYLLMIFYVYKRFIKKLHFSPVFKNIFKYLLILTAVFAVFYLPLKRSGVLDSAVLELFALAVGAGFIFFVLTIIYEFFRLFIKRQKYLFLADIATVFIAVAAIGFAFFEAIKDPKTLYIDLTNSKLTSELKIAHLSDLHLGNSVFMDKNFALKVAKVVDKEDVDLIAITGDLIDAPLANIKESLYEISRMRSKYGIYFVLGNHEYLYDEVSDLINYLKELGIVVLENSNQTVSSNIKIAGIYDMFGIRKGEYIPDIDRAFEGIRSDEFVIYLTHQPKGISKKADLTLAGHTHGGQIFPFGALVLIDQPYLAGVYKDQENAVYVSRGTGFWGPPLRLFAPSEIAIINLKP